MGLRPWLCGLAVSLEPRRAGLWLNSGLGMTRVACVSTGNTSASMAAYASSAGLQPVIFIPYGNISFGKLAQASAESRTTYPAW